MSQSVSSIFDADKRTTDPVVRARARLITVGFLVQAHKLQEKINQLAEKLR